jgi:hypothetical protein
MEVSMAELLPKQLLVPILPKSILYFLNSFSPNNCIPIVNQIWPLDLPLPIGMIVSD